MKKQIVFTPRLELAYALRWVRDRLTERPLGKDEQEKLQNEKGRIEQELDSLTSAQKTEEGRMDRGLWARRSGHADSDILSATAPLHLG